VGYTGLPLSSAAPTPATDSTEWNRRETTGNDALDKRNENTFASMKKIEIPSDIPYDYEATDTIFHHGLTPTNAPAQLPAPAPAAVAMI
jgi:hypothetical protein